MSLLPRFIHLRTHTEYSLLEGAVPVKKLSGMAEAAGMPAVAVTDSNNMFCALEFSEYAAKAGVQPIVGCQVDVAMTGGDPRGRPEPPAAIVLLAQSEQGYENLMKLNSCLYVDKGGLLPQVTVEELDSYSDGLICLTGGPDGPVGRLLRAGQRPAAEALMARLAEIYTDRLYVELQRHPGEGGLPDAEALSEQGHVEMAYAMDLPLVATNDVYFPKSEIYEAHDALICIAEGAYVDQNEPRRRLTPQHYFKTQEEMVMLFSDLPEAVANTVEIAKRCAFKAYKRDPILPKFADDEVEELRRQANEGLQERLAVIPHAVSVEEYQKRLDFELNIIEGMGFPGYFLIVADFIKWAKDQGIPVGPGRGSGAGSLVAYALLITDLDPLRYSLLFERFLNPERVSMPDFDIDFCMDRREEVIRYVQEKYGRDKVGQIITFGALLSKAAVRDVGRVLQLPYSQVDKLSKMIPVEGVKPVSIEKALADEPRLREAANNEEIVDRLLTYGQQIEGLLRNASTHAAGVVIGDRPLDALVPLYQDPRSDMPATQFNMKWVEQAGLVKFDFLGLKTLTVIQRAVNLVLKSGRHLHQRADGTLLYNPIKENIDDISAIPLDDADTFALYKSAQTVGVFQVESDGMKSAIRLIQPSSIDDLVALVGLYRPATLDQIPLFADVKNGKRERKWLHPKIDHLLDNTQGIILFQEQVMQIAQEMAGYSLGGADLLRRAMGKKIQEAMDVEKPKFLEGAFERGFTESVATEIWELLNKFAGYGFNRSHAAAYAVVSYQTAWLKANHPVEFMAGVMNCDIQLTDKLAVYFQEAKKRLNIGYVPPCVNTSQAMFDVKDQKLVYALGALKNVGVEAMKLIVAGREAREFVNVFDFARRCDLKRIGKRPLEMLARAGAFDVLDPNRRRIFNSLDSLTAYSAAFQDQKSSGQVSLFGDTGEDLLEPRLACVTDWLPAERLAEEFKAIGFYLSGHPLDDYMAALRRNKVLTLDEVMARAATGAALVKMAGIVSGRQERKSARGNRFAFVQLSDPTSQFEVTVFSDTLEASRDWLDSGSQVVLKCEAIMEADQLKLLGHSIKPIDNVVAEASGAGLRIFIIRPEAISSVATILENEARDNVGTSRGPVIFCLTGDGLPGEVDIDLGQDYPVSVRIKQAISSLDGINFVESI